MKSSSKSETPTSMVEIDNLKAEIEKYKAEIEDASKTADRKK